MKRFLVMLAACTPSVPDQPSFQEDVMPILAANCVRCHGYPAIGGAPDAFRLDTYDDLIVRPGSPTENCGPTEDPSAAVVLCGAARMAPLAAQRLRDTMYPMPPRFPLDDYQIEVLERWATTTERGRSHVGNQRPVIALESLAIDATTAIARVAVDDADGDLVGGGLVLQLPGGEERMIGVVRSGTYDLTLDIEDIAPGTYLLHARLDDGAGPIETSLGNVTIGGAP